MSQDIDELDHLLTYVQDLDAAARAYERLGFRLTPTSDITTMGIANRLIPMRPRTPGAANFIELMAVRDTGRLPEAMRPILSGHQGIKSMVMMSRDIAGAQARLAERGYPFAPPAHISREWVIPGEGSVWPEFDVMLPIPAPLAFNVCQYHNVELYLREEWLEHPNGAQHMLACLAVSTEPSATIGYFAALFGRQAREGADGGHAVSPGATDLVVYDAQAFEQRYGFAPEPGADARFAGYRVAVRSLAKLHALLDGNQVAHQNAHDRILVGPDAACGNLLEFVELNA